MSNDVITIIVKINSQTAGRDRFFRLLQYSSKLLGWLLDKHLTNKELPVKLRNLELTIAAARKLFRFGRAIDAFYSALNTLSLEDLTLRTTLTLSRINFALYLIADHVLYLESVGLSKANKEKWSRLSNKFWLYSIVMSLARDLYELIPLLSGFSSQSCLSTANFSTASPTEILANTIRDIYRWTNQNKELTIDTVKNACDFWLPYAALGHVSFSPGLIGMLGVISSVVGIFPLINSSYKLVPS